MGRDLREYIIASYQKAMDYHYIQAYYQPVIRTVSRHLCSFEALARWNDPDLGMIYPDEFIPVLESIRAIHLLDSCIIRQACARIRHSFDVGTVPVPISVNLSRLDFELCDIFAVVDGIVSEYQIPHDFIYIEITESVMAEKKETMLGIVSQFRNAGYQVWMDDFGSGYSSLNVLKEFTFDELKLDMIFLRPWNKRSQRIATKIIEMAKTIDIHTLVEGVETEEQYRYLRNIGCEKVQGYYFGKPMPYEEALANMKKQGIRTELPQNRRYYDDIGQINILSAVPFMTREESDAITSARDLNSIPLIMVEFRKKSFRILFYNTAFERVAQNTGMFALNFSEDILRRDIPYHLLSERIINLMDSTHAEGTGKMDFTSHDEYYEINTKCFASTPEKYMILASMINLSKNAKTANTNQLDEFTRDIFSVYERVSIIDVRNDRVTPLFIATREHLVADTDIESMGKAFAERYIFPEDREEFRALVDPATAKERFETTGRTRIMKFLRSSVRHGQYAWKAFTLARVEEDKYILMIANVHDAMMDLRKKAEPDQNPESRAFLPGNLWQNLINSGLLRIFWKDHDRRFVGASPAFLNYYGFQSIHDIKGKNDEDLGWHVHPDAYMSDEMRVIHEGVTTHNIPGQCMNEGENKEILASKTPLYDENGEISGLLGYFIDRELLTENDLRGKETGRRDLLTGLLNSRGIAEESMSFRDAYYLRGIDFGRIHISIDDFASLNEQYGFDFGDKIIYALGVQLMKRFGRTCAVGRVAGQKFVILCQSREREKIHELRKEIKKAAAVVKDVEGIPVTLYLSVGYVLFSEYLDLDEMPKIADVRLLADHDRSIAPESRMTKASDIFHLFDNLPVVYAVFHVTINQDGSEDAKLFYANRKYLDYGTQPASVLLGHSVHELYPFIGEEWYRDIRKAAMDNEIVEGDLLFTPDGKTYHYVATQIIYPGYCAVTYLPGV